MLVVFDYTSIAHTIASGRNQKERIIPFRIYYYIILYYPLNLNHHGETNPPPLPERQRQRWKTEERI